MDLFARALSVIYLGDPRIFKCVKWDRDVLGCNRVSVVDQRSVLVLARRISKGEVFLKLEV